MEPSYLIITVIAFCVVLTHVTWWRIRRAHQVLVQTDEKVPLATMERKKSYVRRIEELATLYAPSDKIAAVNAFKVGSKNLAVPA
jgi:hypothetical protein